jgi:hypothetical protein
MSHRRSRCASRGIVPPEAERPLPDPTPPSESGQRRYRPGDVVLLFHSGLALTLLIQLAAAALTWPMNGPVLPVLVMPGPALPVVVAAALAFGFAWLLALAKAPEVETPRIAKPTMMVFFVFRSLE